MDIVTDIFNGGTELLKGASALVAGLLLVLLTPARLVSMAGSALANIFYKMSTQRGLKLATDTRLLPVDGRNRSAQAHLEASANRAFRIEAYRDMRNVKKADREGPYAVTLFIEDLFDTNFQLWQQSLKEAIVEFDRREEIVRKIIYKMTRRTDRIWLAFEDSLNRQELALIGRQMRWAASIALLRRQKTPMGFWRCVRTVRAHRKAWKLMHKTFRRDKARRDKMIAKTEARYNGTMKGCLAWLESFEREHLLHNIHTFQADWASSLQTVESGRTLGRLLDAKSPRTREVRGLLKLDHLPWDREELRAFVCNQLLGRVGLNPNAQLEDAFEAWLRIHYLDLGAENCPDIGDLGKTGFYLWVAQLAPPGAKGLAHAKYAHGGLPDATGTYPGWVVPLPSPPYMDGTPH